MNKVKFAIPFFAFYLLFLIFHFNLIVAEEQNELEDIIGNADIIVISKVIDAKAFKQGNILMFEVIKATPIKFIKGKTKDITIFVDVETRKSLNFKKEEPVIFFLIKSKKEKHYQEISRVKTLASKKNIKKVLGVYRKVLKKEIKKGDVLAPNNKCIKFTLLADRKIYQIGEEINVTFEFKNIQDKKAAFLYQPLYEKGEILYFCTKGKITVTKDKTQSESKVKRISSDRIFYKVPEDSAVGVQVLGPKESFELSFNLAKFFEISKVGAYKIEVSLGEKNELSASLDFTVLDANTPDSIARKFFYAVRWKSEKLVKECLSRKLSAEFEENPEGFVVKWFNTAKIAKLGKEKAILGNKGYVEILENNKSWKLEVVREKGTWKINAKK